APSGARQAGQLEPGRTTDRPRGTRWMTTLANDPKARPSSPARTEAVSGLMAGKGTAAGPPGPVALPQPTAVGRSSGAPPRAPAWRVDRRFGQVPRRQPRR